MDSSLVSASTATMARSDGQFAFVGTALSASGLTAFASLALLALVAGLASLFAARLARRAPHTLAIMALLVAVTGPASWVAVLYLANEAYHSNASRAAGHWAINAAANVVMTRLVLAPIVLFVEAVSLVVARSTVARVLLALAMLMDLIPLIAFAWRIARNLSWGILD